MNYWVLSPNVLNDKNLLNNFLEIINKEHIALMGYNKEDNSGVPFNSSIKKGDIIIISKGANNNKKNYFAGIVNSDSYKYKFNGRDLQARKLKYFTDISNKNISWNSDCTYGNSSQPKALYELKSYNPNDKKVIDEVLSYINSGGKMTEYIELLKSNKNLILTGAPGTGKTYLAKEIASEIGKYKFVQFHPSYDYTDFVEGLRPIQDKKGDIIFERKDGVFKKFCKEALNNKNDNFVFIIDEINRGEISKIFGELFFSVDSGYRGEKGKVQTQYANLIEDGDEFKDGFYIPENVYIIGTMNDIDRSVESMDFAMRRRFAWKEIKAEDTQETILKDLGDLKDETIKRMNNLNKVIRNKETNLSEAYCIGAAYFKKIKDNDYNGDFNKLWENHLKGLLFEYTRGMPKQEEIMENLKKAYYSNNTKTENNNEEENKNS